jgi:poly(hydroxyalkanoate) depolymerase family esterase
MRRALEKTCVSDPGTATAIIQSALSGQRPPETEADCITCTAAATGNSAGAAMQRPGRSQGRPSGLSGTRIPGTMGFPGLNVSAGGGGLPGMDSLSGLLALDRKFGPNARARVAPVPDGARVEMRRHSGQSGARDYRLFVPSPREGGPAGLVLMLHGCTQSPEDFALGTRMDLAAEAAGMVVAYPGQTGQHNAQSCWNWFRPEDQARGSGEPALLASLATALAAEFEVTGRVYVAGLSAGGAMAAILAETYPDVFAAVGIHSGLPSGCARDVPSAFAAMRGQGAAGRAPRVPAIVFHGTADGTVSPGNASALVPGSGIETRHAGAGRSWSRLTTPEGSELWLVDGAGHAWFGGDAGGSYADPAGPDASAEMLRFFLQTKDVA